MADTMEVDGVSAKANGAANGGDLDEGLYSRQL
jgi:hypothetical protein